MFLLPAAVGVYLLLLRRKVTADIRYSSITVVCEAMEPRQHLRRHVPALIVSLGFATLLVGVARPAAVTPTPAARGTVVLAMDVSLSMAAMDVAPTRLAAAQAAATAFIEAQPVDGLIGLVAFARHAEVLQSPTSDRRTLTTALAQLRLQPYTSLGNGLIGALLMIRKTVQAHRLRKQTD